jgi:cytoskeleton protein RodZ
MASFGEGLRREREMRGITLEEISAHTKISIHFLQAIEADDLGKLPGGIYTRNFIRAFARYLGLDEEKVMSEYQSSAHPGRDFDLSRLTSARPTREPPSATWIGLLLAAAMLTGGYVLFRYSQRTAGVPQSAAQAATATGPKQPAPAPVQPAAPPPSPAVNGSEGVAPANPSGDNQAHPSSPAPSAAAAPNTMASSAPQATGSATHTAAGTQNAAAPEGVEFAGAGADLVLQVAATDRSWVDLGADGKTVLQRVLTQDEIQTFKAKKYFDLTTGNAEGIVLTLNGETLGPLGRRGEVKKVHLTLDSLKHPPSN